MIFSFFTVSSFVVVLSAVVFSEFLVSSATGVYPSLPVSPLIWDIISRILFCILLKILTQFVTTFKNQSERICPILLQPGTIWQSCYRRITYLPVIMRLQKMIVRTVAAIHPKGHAIQMPVLPKYCVKSNATRIRRIRSGTVAITK